MRQTLTERVVLAIKVEMLRQNLSTTDLAAQLGESYLWLNRRLKLVTPFLLEDVNRVADALHVPLTHLIAEDQVNAA